MKIETVVRTVYLGPGGAEFLFENDARDAFAEAAKQEALDELADILGEDLDCYDFSTVQAAENLWVRRAEVVRLLGGSMEAAE